MSVQTQIDRIEAAKEAIAAAIAEKGVTVPAGAKIDDMAPFIDGISSGTDTSDATATANDIIAGKTAYSADGKMTGAVPLIAGKFEVDAQPVWNSSYNLIQTSFSFSQRNAYENGATIRFSSDGAYFGDATAADVAKGKTFTSASGLKLAGTLENDNFYSTEVTLASDYSTQAYTTICTIPFLADNRSNDNLFVMLLLKDTTATSYSIPVVMGCNSPYLIGSYALGIKKTSYGTSVSIKTSTDTDYKLTNGRTTSAIARVYVTSSGGVRIYPETSYMFVAGTYSVIYGIL